MPVSQLHMLPAIFCYRDGHLRERLVGKTLLDEEDLPPDAEELEYLLEDLGVLDDEPAPRSDEAPPPPPDDCDAPPTLSGFDDDDDAAPPTLPGFDDVD